MKISEILKNIKITEKNVDFDVQITNISSNSRAIAPNGMFIAIKGFEVDGNNYINNALQNGALVIVTDEKPTTDFPYVLVDNAREIESKIAVNFYENPSKDVDIIGVTGTNGKTTATYFLKHALDSLGKKVGLIGTNQNIINNVETNAERTTEGALQVQQMLATLRDCDSDNLVMEVSSHALCLNRVDDISFKIGVFTNLSRDHLDFHKTLEEYAKAKAKLFEKSEFGVVNIDDEYSSLMLESKTCKYLTFGIENEKADLNAINLVLTEKSVKFDICYNDKVQEIEVFVPGKFNVQNALSAIGALLCLGYSLEQISDVLKTTKGVKGRVEVVDIGTDYTVIIDYAHTPDGILNVLKTIKDFAKGRVIALFGCGGDRDKTKRPLMGKAVCKYADICIVTSDNPRTENPESIIEDILQGIKDEEYEVIVDRRKAIKYAKDIAQKDDIVVLLGKGHETYQEINGQKFDFDEREIVLL